MSPVRRAYSWIRQLLNSPTIYRSYLSCPSSCLRWPNLKTIYCSLHDLPSFPFLSSHNLQSQKSEVHDDAGLWQIHIWPPNLRGDPSVILCHLHKAKPRRSMLWWKIAILPTLHPVEISLRFQETNMHHDARCNFKHLLGHLHSSHRLHFSHAISVTILPTHRNNVCGRKIIIKDQDLGWGGECGKVIFVPKPLSHHPTHHVRFSLALPMSNTMNVSNNRLSLHNLSDFIYEYWPSIVVS